VKHSRTSGSTVRPGSVAPPFSLNDSPHSRISLRDLRGRPAVLVFYVADWHPVAAEQLRQLEVLRTRLGDGAPALIGISIDATWSHAAFARDLEIKFPLLADDQPPGAVARAYGVDSTETGRGRRAVIVIDAAGIVRWSAVFPDALNPGLDGILTALEALAAPGETSPSGS
jgi:peroxiredoxin